jgi:hypothetical protein
MDLLKQSQLRELVVNSLMSVSGRRRGESITIFCPWHSERNPSLHVHVGHKVIPGSFQCFGCGAKGNWNDLARALRLPVFDFRDSAAIQITPDSDQYTALIQQVISEFNQKNNTDTLKYLKGIEELPDDFTWRGYSAKFYKRLGARYYWNRKLESSYLYFPLTMCGEYKGYTLCCLDGKDEKYQIFAESRKTFFLYDHVPTGGPLVLVEGHFDAMRLWAEGISALGIFGIKNWSNIKKSYLLTKNPSKVVICFDGDRPGYDGAVSIWKDLKISYHNVDIFYLPYIAENKLDPGNMPSPYIDHLRSLLDV